MHELTMIQSIFPLIEEVAKENNLKAITRVVLGVGELRQVQQDFLQFAFVTIAENTIAQGAKLTVNLIPVMVFCQDCKREFMVHDNVYVCPECHGVSLDFLTGKELVLESVDGET